MRFVVQTTNNRIGVRPYHVLDLAQRDARGEATCVDCFDEDPWHHGERAAELAEGLARRLNERHAPLRSKLVRFWN